MAIVRALVLLSLAAVVLFLLPRREAEHSAWSEPDDGIQPVDPYVLSATKVAAEAQAVWYPTMGTATPTNPSWTIGSTLYHTH